MSFEIYYDDNFLTEEEYNLLEKEFANYKWELVGSSIIGDYSNCYHWDKDLKSSEFINSLFMNKVRGFLKKKIETLRIYANGNTHGQCGLPHLDVPEDLEGEYYSLVYYFHENWKPEYGGHLIIMQPDGKIIENIFPKSNSAVLFNSKTPHCPLEPTVHCKSMRISIAYKFRVVGD